MASSKTVVAALAFGAVVSAFKLESLSQSCQTTISELTIDPDISACIASNQLLNIFVAPSDESAVKTTANWLTAFCGTAPACTEGSISKAASAVQTGCGEDLAQFGVTGDYIAAALPYVQKYWNTAKEVACLTDTTVGQFCAPAVASKIESSLSTNVSLNWIANEIKTSVESHQFQLPKDAVCTPCTQAALVKIADTELSKVVDLKALASDFCGPEFADVKEVPPTVIIGVGEEAPKSQPQPSDTDSNAAAMLSIAGPLFVTMGLFAATLL